MLGIQSLYLFSLKDPPIAAYTARCSTDGAICVLEPRSKLDRLSGLEHPDPYAKRSIIISDIQERILSLFCLFYRALSSLGLQVAASSPQSHYPTQVAIPLRL